MTPLPITIEAITPLVIHSGETLGYMDIVLDDSLVRRIHPERVFAAMTTDERTATLAAFEAGQEARFRELITDCVRRHPELVSYTLETWKQRPAGLSANSQLEIFSVLRDPLTSRLVIPGSSIKGAIRTAIADLLRTRANPALASVPQNTHRAGTDSVRYERQLLRGQAWDDRDYNQGRAIGDDPFRFFKVSDCHFDEANALITSVGIGRLDTLKQGNPALTVISEASFSARSHGQGIIARGTLNLDTKGIAWNHFDWKKNQVEQVFTPEGIVQALRHFYGQANNTAHPNPGYHLDAIDPASGKLLTDRLLNPKAAPVRLGHYGQIESKTLKPDGGAWQANKSGGVSRALINCEVPAGWAVLTIG